MRENIIHWSIENIFWHTLLIHGQNYQRFFPLNNVLCISLSLCTITLAWVILSSGGLQCSSQVAQSQPLLLQRSPFVIICESASLTFMSFNQQHCLPCSAISSPVDQSSFCPESLLGLSEALPPSHGTHQKSSSFPATFLYPALSYSSLCELYQPL